MCGASSTQIHHDSRLLLVSTVAVSVLALTALTSDAVSALAEMPLVKAVSDAKATLVVASSTAGAVDMKVAGATEAFLVREVVQLDLGREAEVPNRSRRMAQHNRNEMLGWVPPCHNVQVLAL